VFSVPTISAIKLRNRLGYSKVYNIEFRKGQDRESSFADALTELIIFICLQCLVESPHRRELRAGNQEISRWDISNYAPFADPFFRIPSSSHPRGLIWYATMPPDYPRRMSLEERSGKRKPFSWHQTVCVQKRKNLTLRV
jgi:hypothetical protein